MGEVRFLRKAVNSRDIQALARVEVRYPIEGERPGVPNKEGRIAVHPMLATFLPNSATRGVMPGISDITITAGPFPILNTS